MYPVHILLYQLLKIHSNVILPPAFRPPKWSLPFKIHMVKMFPDFMEPESSPPCSKECAIGYYSEPVKFTSHIKDTRLLI